MTKKARVAPNLYRVAFKKASSQVRGELSPHTPSPLRGFTVALRRRPPRMRGGLPPTAPSARPRATARGRDPAGCGENFPRSVRGCLSLFERNSVLYTILGEQNIIAIVDATQRCASRSAEGPPVDVSIMRVGPLQREALPPVKRPCGESWGESVSTGNPLFMSVGYRLPCSRYLAIRRGGAFLLVGLLNQPARTYQSVPSYLKESFMRARYSTIFPFSIRTSSLSTSAILRSLRLLVEVSMTSFAASSQEFGLVPTTSTIL